MVKFVVFCTKVIAAAIAAVLFNSCHSSISLGDGIDGNGNVITKTRNVDNNFTKVDVSRGLTVVLQQSDIYIVKVEADENLQSHITTTVEDGTLFITTDEDIDNAVAKTIYVKLPLLTSVKASSSSEISSRNVFTGTDISLRASSSAEIDMNLEIDNISCSASSSASIDIRGIALTLNADSSSSSEINAKELIVNDVIAESSSSSSMDVHPVVKLEAKASSSSSIDYYSSPKTVTKVESSSGSVSKQ
jgi:hypothetical protein